MAQRFFPKRRPIVLWSWEKYAECVNSYFQDFTTALSSSNETGKVTGNLETKYKNAKHGKLFFTALCRILSCKAFHSLHWPAILQDWHYLRNGQLTMCSVLISLLKTRYRHSAKINLWSNKFRFYNFQNFLGVYPHILEFWHLKNFWWEQDLASHVRHPSN
jgi:hypothetical protein